MKLEGLTESEMEAYHQDLKKPPPPREKLRGCRVRKSSCTMYVFFMVVRTTIGDLLNGLSAASTSILNIANGPTPGSSRPSAVRAIPVCTQEPPSSFPEACHDPPQPFSLALRPDRRRRRAAARAAGSPVGLPRLYGRSGGSPWQATQIVLVLYWNPLLLRTELIRSIWI